MLNLSQQHPVVNEESKPFEFPNISNNLRRQYKNKFNKDSNSNNL